MKSIPSIPSIVGVGNTLRGDDGVGPAVVELLRGEGLAGRAELVDAGLAFAEAVCDLEPRRPLIIIDAVDGGGRPGTIYRLGLSDLAEAATPAVSLHEASVLPVLRMEALTGRVFADVTVYGVEPGGVDWGEGLSPPAAAAAERLVRIIRDEIEIAGGAGATPAPTGSQST